MANSKSAFYVTSLYAALTAGDWTSKTPARGVKRSWLSWSELLRKFRKHCPPPHDISELASHTQALSLLLIRSRETTPEALDGDHTNLEQPLTLGAECLLLEERREEARLNYRAMEKLHQSTSVYLTRAYYAFALGLYDDSLSHLSSVDFEEPVNTLTVGTISSVTSASASHDSRTTTGSAVGAITPIAATLDIDIKDGKIWLATERIRGKCIQGMVYESLINPSLNDALVSYESGLPFLDHIGIPKSLPSQTGKASMDSFTRYRELWRWVERLLWRAAIVSAKIRPLSHTRRILTLYRTHSVHWPATFRPEHRSTIYELYLDVLLHMYTPATKLAWLNETRSVVTDYRIVVTATSTFPRSGERNVKVEEFVDLCMAAWEAAGASSEQTGWVVDILWWATRLTFNSHRIYRHLSRTLYASGDTDLARRMLRLYVQVVSKARETGAYEEHDRVWVETLVQGARMLCRVPGGIEEAREAGELIRRAAERLNKEDKESAAALKRAEGIWHTCMAIREQEPSTRPMHLEASLTSLKESLALHPMPSTHFHLALALAWPGPSRDLPSAIANAREAVEGDSSEVRYLHLLGLLLSATEHWDDAKAVLELGAEVVDREEIDGGDETVEDNGAREPMNGHVQLEDLVGPDTPQAWSRNALLAENALQLPAAATLRRRVPDYPPPTRQERFDHALQLRLTQLALIEYVDGPENAGEKWLQVFRWVAEQKGLGEERGPPSVEPPPSDTNSSGPTPQASQPYVSIRASLDLTHPLSDENPDIPINLTPPTPLATPERRDSMSPEGTHKQAQDLPQDKDGQDTSKGKKVQRILRERVHKGQAHIHTISRRIGRGGRHGRHAAQLKRANSAPDFHAALSNSTPYRVSSIHSHQRLAASHVRPNSPEPPPRPASPHKQPSIFAGRSARERRLLSNLWLTSAATFRRMGKIEQAKGAIQEAEVADEENEDVWVQLGLYFAALGQTNQAIASFQKALFIQSDHVPAFVYLSQQYLTPPPTAAVDATGDSALEPSPSRDNIDLAAGILSNLTRGAGWDVPEAWYFLARACGLQGKRQREQECLSFALNLIEGRGVRDLKVAVGWCL